MPPVPVELARECVIADAYQTRAVVDSLREDHEKEGAKNSLERISDTSAIIRSHWSRRREVHVRKVL